MHIVGIDLCHRLDIEDEVILNEMALLNEACFAPGG